jgi:hypothetical protein
MQWLHDNGNRTHTQMGDTSLLTANGIFAGESYWGDQGVYRSIFQIISFLEATGNEYHYNAQLTHVAQINMPCDYSLCNSKQVL